MCLILLAWQVHPRYPLVVAANRDEFFDRPSAPAQFWTDAPQVLGGRDLAAGGTWLAVSRSARFAALTNYRDPASNRTDAPSRGALVARWVSGDERAQAYGEELTAAGARYNGFNLIYGERTALHYLSNVAGRPHALAPGIYGLSNHLLDTPWPKVAQAKSDLARALDALPEFEPCFALLRDERVHPDDALPRTGVSLEWERLLSAAFVRSPGYGTRSSTVLTVARDGAVRFVERSFDAQARVSAQKDYGFVLEG